MLTLVIVIAVVAVASALALVVNRRPKDVPSAPQFAAPQQLDRSDFESGETPWLLLLFSSSTCLSCRDAHDVVFAVRTPQVHVQELPVETTKALHTKYAVDAVPTVVMADAEGVVQWSYLGPPPKTAVAELLEDIGLVPPEGGTAVDID